MRKNAGKSRQDTLLTPAELSVVECLRAYKSNKEIAAILGKSPATVRNQLYSIFRKLNVRNRAEAIGATSHPSGAQA